MSRTSALICLLICTFGDLPRASRAAPPAPITSALYDFPVGLASPSSAVSAGLVLSDRWLGEEPAGNPAAAPHRTVVIAPALVRVSRQDIAADNRHFAQQAAFVDVASASFGLDMNRFGVSGYVFQPVLRREAIAFERNI